MMFFHCCKVKFHDDDDDGDGTWNYLKCLKYINCIPKASIMYLHDPLGLFKFI